VGAVWGQESSDEKVLIAQTCRVPTDQRGALAGKRRRQHAWTMHRVARTHLALRGVNQPTGIRAIGSHVRRFGRVEDAGRRGRHPRSPQGGVSTIDEAARAAITGGRDQRIERRDDRRQQNPERHPHPHAAATIVRDSFQLPARTPLPDCESYSRVSGASRENRTRLAPTLVEPA